MVRRGAKAKESAVAGMSAAHLDNSGKYPAGGNLNYLDGHVAWQKTKMEGRKLVGMVERTSGTPVFYW